MQSIAFMAFEELLRSHHEHVCIARELALLLEIPVADARLGRPVLPVVHAVVNHLAAELMPQVQSDLAPERELQDSTAFGNREVPIYAGKAGMDCRGLRG